MPNRSAGELPAATLHATVRLGKSKAIRTLQIDAGAIGAAALKKSHHVVVRTDRGTEVATLVADPSTDERLRATVGGAPAEEVAFVRAALQVDVDRANALLERDEMDEFAFFRQKVKELGLPMKPVQVEHLFGGERIVFFFSSDERVDFRGLVRILASRYQTRVELRRIPPRAAAAMGCGVGVCGRELCCTTWLKVLEPVSMKLAREQSRPVHSDGNLGACGRLRCCLRYELDGRSGCGRSADVSSA